MKTRKNNTKPEVKKDIFSTMVEITEPMTVEQLERFYDKLDGFRIATSVLRDATDRMAKIKEIKESEVGIYNS